MITKNMKKLQKTTIYFKTSLLEWKKSSRKSKRLRNWKCNLNRWLKIIMINSWFIKNIRQKKDFLQI